MMAYFNGLPKRPKALDMVFASLHHKFGKGGSGMQRTAFGSSTALKGHLKGFRCLRDIETRSFQASNGGDGEAVLEDVERGRDPNKKHNG